MKRAPLVFIGLLAVIAVASTIFLHPADTEIALMEMEDRHFARAQQQYEALLEQGDYSMNVVMPLCRIYMEQGQVDKATDTMRRYAEKHPESLLALRQLAQYEHDAQHYYGYVRILEVIRARKPDMELLRELAEYYQFLGEHEARLSALSDLVQLPDSRPEEKEILAVVEMMGQRGQQQEALAIMDRYFKTSMGHASRRATEIALFLLLDTNRKEDALKLVQDYLVAHDKPEDTQYLSRFLRYQNQADLAWEILKPHEERLAKEPALLDETFYVLLAQGKKNEAMMLLKPYLKAKTVPVSMKEPLLDLAMEFEDEALVSDVVNAFPDAEISESLFISAAQVALKQQKPGIVRPLLPLALKHFGKNSVTVLLLETAADPSESHLKALNAHSDLRQLTQSQRIAIANLMFRIHLAPQALTMLEPVPMQEVLQELGPRDLAELYLKGGKAPLAQSAIRAMGHLTDKSELALALLAIGQGEAKPFLSWSDHFPQQADEDTIELAYHLAVTYGHIHPASLLALLYEKKPTPERLIELVEALLAEGALDSALAHLKTMSPENPEIRQLIFTALEKTRQQRPGLKSYQADAERLLELLISNVAASANEQRELGYALIQAGLPKKAEPIFARLAQSSVSPNDDDVRQWADLWSSPPTKAQQDWVSEKVHGGDELSRISWLEYLLAKDAHAEVLQLIDSLPEGQRSAAIRKLYLETLGTQKNKNRAEAFLKTELKHAESVDDFRRTARAAEEQELNSIALDAYRQIQKRHPADPEANRRLGFHALEGGRIKEARTYLQRALAGADEDVEVLRALGESWQHDNPSKAVNYYDQALSSINHLQKRDFETRRLQAQLLYLTNQKEKSRLLYRTLLDEQPGNTDLRADFASMLMEMRQFDEANKVLLQQGD